jgi:hypothetical protein
MRKTIRLTESDLVRLVKRTIREMEDDRTFTSFGDEDDWYDDEDKNIGDFDFDFDEEEFDDLDKYSEKYPKQSLKKFGKGDSSRSIFNQYRDKKGPLKVRRRRD